MKLSSGAQANYTGNALEKFIESRINEKGYQRITPKKFEASIYLKQPIYARQFYIGPSIYQTKMYCDFILYHPQKWEKCLVIESKWQQSSGSVDEKYPYLILNIQQSAYETILVLDGGGYKKQAKTWLKKQIGNNLLNVFNMSEFQIWANEDKL